MHGIFLMNDVRNNSLYYYNVSHVHGDEIHQKLKGFNNSKYQAFTINSTGANSQGALIAKSSIGNHTFVTGPTYDIGRLVIDIAEQQSSNCYGECYLALKYGLSNDTSSSLKKKTQYYDVNWSSYNYDIWSTQYEPELRYPGTSWGDVEDQVNAGYANNRDPDTWKYCMCVDGDTSGQYDDMPDNMGLAGEVYFNTYGGVDGYCDDSHCGAQTGRMYLSHQNKLREYMKTDYFLQTKKAKRFSQNYIK